MYKRQRYNRETLEVKFKGKSIADVLDMTVDEAYEFFINIERLKVKLQTLKDVGLGYIKPVSYTHLDVYKRQCEN